MNPTDFSLDEMEAFVLGDASPLVALVRRNEDLRREMRRNERRIRKMAMRQAENLEGPHVQR